MNVMLDGEPLTEDEVATLLSGTEDLVLLRGQWVEVDRARFEKTMERFREAEALAAKDGLSFAEAMRMLAGAAVTGRRAGGRRCRLVAGDRWPVAGADAEGAARSPDGEGADPGPALQGTLRPYQRAGTQWMHLLSSLGLGACLADDMGLGKTIQVLSLLLVEKAAWPAEPAGGAGLAAGQLGGGSAKNSRPG